MCVCLRSKISLNRSGDGEEVVSRPTTMAICARRLLSQRKSPPTMTSAPGFSRTRWSGWICFHCTTFGEQPGRKLARISSGSAWFWSAKRLHHATNQTPTDRQARPSIYRLVGSFSNAFSATHRADKTSILLLRVLLVSFAHTVHTIACDEHCATRRVAACFDCVSGWVGLEHFTYGV